MQDFDTRELMECLQKGKASIDDGKHALGLQMYERAIQLSETNGSHGAYIEQALDGLAECQSQTGNHSGAADSLQRLLFLKEKAYGASHVQTLRISGKLGKELHRCGRTKDAVNLLQKTCQNAEAIMRRNDATLIGMLETYEAALRADGARATADQVAARIEAARNNKSLQNGKRRATDKPRGVNKPLAGLCVAIAVLMAIKFGWDILAKPAAAPAKSESSNQ